MKSINIHNMPDDVYMTLQAMAKANQRSLQEHICFILEREAQLANRSFLARAAEWRKRLEGRNLSNAVNAVREDRER